jgi:hypothetical protein
LYRSLGFVEIEAYSPNPAREIAFFEKKLPWGSANGSAPTP